MKGSNDLILIKEALIKKNKKAELKKNLSPLVDKIVGLYVDENITKKELEKTAWVYFDFAMKKYVENSKKKPLKDYYKFSTYFSWYIKTSIETYLGISETSLNKTPKPIKTQK